MFFSQQRQGKLTSLLVLYHQWICFEDKDDFGNRTDVVHVMQKYVFIVGSFVNITHYLF